MILVGFFVSLCADFNLVMFLNNAKMCFKARKTFQIHAKFFFKQKLPNIYAILSKVIQTEKKSFFNLIGHVFEIVRNKL